MTAQDALLASLETLLELHYVSLPPPKPPKRRLYDPPPTLERFCNLSAVTVTNVHHMAGASSLPALPVSVQKLTLDAGLGSWVAEPQRRCGSCHNLSSMVEQTARNAEAP